VETTKLMVCPLCEAMCGLSLTVQDGAVTSVRGDPDDPFSQGHICPKASALPDLHTDPDRLRHPVRRTGDGWERVSWDDALADIADRIVALQTGSGRDSVATYFGNPSVHSLGIMLAGPALRRALGSRNQYSATSVDQLPQMLTAHLMFGHRLLMHVPDLDHTQLLVVIGANPLVSNGSLMSAPGMRRRLRELRARGGRLVVIDPRRTATAAAADTHHFIRPGTDGLLLLALVHEAMALGPRLGHLAEHVTGLDDLRAAVSPFSADAVAPATGIPADAIRDLAQALHSTPAAAVYGRVGVCVQRSGSLNSWLITALNAVTGHLDTRGGVMFAQPAADSAYPPGRPHPGGGFGRWGSRVRGLPEFYRELPVAALAEEILTPGDGQVRAFVCIAGNPVLSTPDGGQLDRALASLDLCVAVDTHITETSRHAHYILPPVSPLARPHYDLAFHMLAVRNTARWADPVLEDDGDLLQDDAILLGLARRVARAHGAPLRQRLGLRAQAMLGPARQVDLSLRLGPRGGLRGLSLAEVRRHPHGLDLGPLESCLLERLPPGFGAIRLAPDALVADVERVHAQLDEKPPPLVLIGRRELRSNNSWMHNSRRLVKGPERCVLEVHPDDAAARGIATGDTVRLTSRVGAVDVPASVTDAVMSGVVCLPHGYGHGRPGTRQRVAAERPGVSANDLTDAAVVDPVSGNAVLTAVPVTLQVIPGR
jgi:anaerobic selenocysteine-containing dehydrogenase